MSAAIPGVCPEKRKRKERAELCGVRTGPRCVSPNETSRSLVRALRKHPRAHCSRRTTRQSSVRSSVNDREARSSERRGAQRSGEAASRPEEASRDFRAPQTFRARADGSPFRGLRGFLRQVRKRDAAIGSSTSEVLSAVSCADCLRVLHANKKMEFVRSHACMRPRRPMALADS